MSALCQVGCAVATVVAIGVGSIVAPCCMGRTSRQVAMVAMGIIMAASCIAGCVMMAFPPVIPYAAIPFGIAAVSCLAFAILYNSLQFTTD